MWTDRLAAWAVAVALAAGIAQGEILFDRDGVILEGTVRMAARDAAVCQVSEQGHLADMRERIRANHGQPLHVWRVDFVARNGSGKPLAQLKAYFSIASERPPCMAWSEPAGSYPKEVRSTGLWTVLRKPNGMEPGEEVGDAVFLLTFHDQQPAFESWNVEYRFLTGTVPGPTGAISSGRSAEGAVSAREAADGLPPEIQADRYLLKAEQAVRDGDWVSARLAMEQLEAIQEEHGLEPTPDDHFRYAQAWEGAGEPERALQSAVRYLQVRGREAEFYTEALELINRAEPTEKIPEAGVSAWSRNRPQAVRTPLGRDTELASQRPAGQIGADTDPSRAVVSAQTPPPEVTLEPGPSIDGASNQTADQATGCNGWTSKTYWETATPADVTACIEAGADLKARDAAGDTFMVLAAKHNGNPDVFEALREAMAQLNRQQASRSTGRGEFLIEDRIKELISEMYEGGSEVKGVVDRLIASVEAHCGERFQRPLARYERGVRLQANPNELSAVCRTVGGCALAFRATCAIARLGPPPDSAFALSGDAFWERKTVLEGLEAPTPIQAAEWWALIKREECSLYRYRANDGITGVRMDPCRYCDAAYLE